MKTSTAAYRLTTDELDELHRVAHNAYLQGRYDEAARYFWLLSMHAPTDVRYLKGLGASRFMDKAFLDAAVAYLYLVQIAPKDAEAHGMLGHAFLMLGDRTQAGEHLRQAVRLPGSDAGVVARARALLELVGT